MSAPRPARHAERVIARSTGGPVACPLADAEPEETLRPAFYVLDEQAALLPAPTPSKEV
jgi:hypothetical protein